MGILWRIPVSPSLEGWPAGGQNAAVPCQKRTILWARVTSGHKLLWRKHVLEYVSCWWAPLLTNNLFILFMLNTVL